MNLILSIIIKPIDNNKTYPTRILKWLQRLTPGWSSSKKANKNQKTSTTSPDSLESKSRTSLK
jgi:hypothetical protein